MKKNLKNKITKVIAGMMLACSLLTLFGGVSSEEVMSCVDVIIGSDTKN